MTSSLPLNAVRFSAMRAVLSGAGSCVMFQVSSIRMGHMGYQQTTTSNNNKCTYSVRQHLAFTRVTESCDRADKSALSSL